MLKKETYKLEDSNVALLGSDLDKDARRAAAAHEPAWTVAGKKEGMQIWRIEKFKVKVSQTPIGTFYKDDSYICLRTYTESPEKPKLKWDIHFWLGETTSQDEMGTAAYKTVELDNFLGDDPVQHREVCGYESNQFLSYFTDVGGIRLLEGGIESGFNKVKPEEYRPRLLHLKGRKNIRVVEVPVQASSLNSGDVFILDMGLTLYCWQGKNCGMNERARAGQLCRAIDDERRGLPKVFTHRQGAPYDPIFEDPFWAAFPGGKPAAISDESGSDAAWELDSEKRLFQLSDSSGALSFKLVAEGAVPRSALDSSDVFIFDIGCEIFVWVGRGASEGERDHAMGYASSYVKDFKRPAFLPITRILEGGENEVFESSFDHSHAGSRGKNRVAATDHLASLAKHEDWVIWDAEMQAERARGTGIESLIANLPQDGCVYACIYITKEGVGEAAYETFNDANVILQWKGPTAKKAEGVRQNNSLQKALDGFVPNKGFLEVLGTANLNVSTIFDRWRPGSGSKVIQDGI